MQATGGGLAGTRLSNVQSIAPSVRRPGERAGRSSGPVARSGELRPRLGRGEKKAGRAAAETGERGKDEVGKSRVTREAALARGGLASSQLSQGGHGGLPSSQQDLRAPGGPPGSLGQGHLWTSEERRQGGGTRRICYQPALSGHAAPSTLPD
ncbi:unnamed protein product [Prorocentrum cordatum]|uniref:Uncharacterized protein n=1 Tax=Prorocentrum cordatum TaxID=2364126 RepID=A0ABN9WG08_9DINO|nr:unnamed protein product [Polarella glacialis]